MVPWAVVIKTWHIRLRSFLSRRRQVALDTREYLRLSWLRFPWIRNSDLGVAWPIYFNVASRLCFDQKLNHHSPANGGQCRPFQSSFPRLIGKIHCNLENAALLITLDCFDFPGSKGPYRWSLSKTRLLQDFVYEVVRRVIMTLPTFSVPCYPEWLT